jgi:hypothetical protein
MCKYFNTAIMMIWIRKWLHVIISVSYKVQVINNACGY